MKIALRILIGTTILCALVIALGFSRIKTQKVFGTDGVTYGIYTVSFCDGRRDWINRTLGKFLVKAFYKTKFDMALTNNSIIDLDKVMRAYKQKYPKSSNVIVSKYDGYTPMEILVEIFDDGLFVGYAKFDHTNSLSLP